MLFFFDRHPEGGADSVDQWLAADALHCFLHFDTWTRDQAIYLLSGYAPDVGTDSMAWDDYLYFDQMTRLLDQLYLSQPLHPMQPRWPVSRWLGWAKIHRVRVPWWIYLERNEPDIRPDEQGYADWLAAAAQQPAPAERVTAHPDDDAPISLEEIHRAKADNQTLRHEVERLRREMSKVEEERRYQGVPHERAERSYLHIIGALLDCLMGRWESIGAHPGFPNEARLREFIVQKYSGIGGLSDSNLSRRFPEARRAIGS